MTDREFKKGFLLRAGLLSVALLVPTSAYIAHWLPVRFLGAAFIAVVIPFGVLFWRFARRYSAERHAEDKAPGATLDDTTRKRYRSSILRFRILALLLFSVLIYASLVSAGEPVWPSIFGAAINISMIYACLSTAGRLQRKLRASEARTAQEDHLR